MIATATPLLTVPELDLALWYPELVLVATVMLGLIGTLTSRVNARWLVLAGLAVASGLAVISLSGDGGLPIGPHFAVAATTPLIRLVMILGTFLVLLAWPTRIQRAAPFLTLGTLGVVLLAQAMTVGGMLLAVATTVLGGGLMAMAASGSHQLTRQWLRVAVIGYAILAFGLVFWSGLTGTMSFAGGLALLTVNPSLPALAVPATLAVMLVGLSLALLGEPGRLIVDHGEVLPVPATAWLTTMPPLGLVMAVQNLLIRTDTGQPILEPVLKTVILVGGVLVLGGFMAALAQTRTVRRLAWAASGQVGLALLAVSTEIVTWPMATLVMLAFVPAQLGAVLLAGPTSRRGESGPRWMPALMLTGLLLSLAGVPPLAGWRPRFGLLDSLLAADLTLVSGLVALGVLLGMVVYLTPAVTIWRTAEDAPEEDGGGHGPALSVAGLLLLLSLAWGAGLVNLG